MIYKAIRCGALALLLGLPARADVYTVTATNSSGTGSLAAAISAANAHVGYDNIQFGLTGTAPFIIFLTNGLPTVTEGVSIDAATQAGYTGAPAVVLDGTFVPASPGLMLQANGCIVRGLGIRKFSRGVWLLFCTSNLISSCSIYSNANDGLYSQGSSYCTIGGTQPDAGNVISANGAYGIVFTSESHHNSVLGNRIGTDPSGTSEWPNTMSALDIIGPSNRVGSLNAGEGNLLSGNLEAGVRIDQSTAAGNIVEGNTIGPDATGMVNLSSNQNYGVYIFYAGPSNRIAQNLISGNAAGLASGAGIQANDAPGLCIQGNRIGLDASGTNPMGNKVGISFTQMANILIGGTNTAQRNVISGNVQDGINLTACTNVSVLGNYIGTTTSGLARAGNDDGISIQSENANVVIGSAANSGRNVISGNLGSGINAYDAVTVIGNYIGVAADGVSALGNNSHGIFVGSSNVVIGAAGAGNVIGDSYRDGIRIQANGCRVLGNLIGVGALYQSAVGNGDHGIAFYGGTNNRIGGPNPGEGNVICDNFQAGIYMRTGAAHNVVQGNWIGKTPDGTAFPNWFGVYIENASSNTIGGTGANEGNAIWYNTSAGVRVASNSANTAIGNAILGNTFSSNGLLAIDLQADGRMTNDTGDADTGANGQQNYPVLTNAWSGSTYIQGTLNSAASRTYWLEFFSSPTNDEPGLIAEGAEFIGGTNVTTDGTGNASFSARFARSAPTGWVITATATDPSFNTSEFSYSRPVAKAPDVDGNGIADYWEVIHFGATIGTAATNDPDGDGFSTRQEYFSDTPPTNGGTFPRIESANLANGCTLAFSSSVGRAYTLQRVESLSTQTWQDVTGQVDRAGTGGLDTLCDTNRASRYEYRVRARLP